MRDEHCTDEALIAYTRALLAEYPWPPAGESSRTAAALLDRLRARRQFALLAELADRVARRAPQDAHVRRLQAQALIETGQPSAAIDVIQAVLRKVEARSREWAELNGLLGRAFKQIFIDARKALDATDLAALQNAVRAYRKPREADPSNTWHAINLVAVAACAERMHLRRVPRVDFRALARAILASPPTSDAWDAATRAEAHLALGELDELEEQIRRFLAHDAIDAFAVASTLRQFEQVWELGQCGERSRVLLDAMRARLLGLPGGRCDLSLRELLQSQQAGTAPNARLEAILGTDGTRSYRWWQAGLRSASSVASIRTGLDERIGTGFLVAPGEFGVAAAGALLLTNFHVVNAQGSAGALRAEDASIVFEAVEPAAQYGVKRIVWSSPVDRHDATLIELDGPPPANLEALSIARRLPVRPEDGPSRVYVIGHTGGGGLEFSFQDNELLDHEGPRDNRFDATPCRLHYRAPTEKGNSGSPVFNAADWKVIALHHAGGTLSRLNGKPDTYPANEGIAVLSIISAMRAG